MLLILTKYSQVGTFLILKSDDAAVSASKPPALWRVDGKTLIQKYESIDGERRYKCVNTYSGWTANTRYTHIGDGEMRAVGTQLIAVAFLVSYCLQTDL